MLSFMIYLILYTGLYTGNLIIKYHSYYMLIRRKHCSFCKWIDNWNTYEELGSKNNILASIIRYYRNSFFALEFKQSPSKNRKQISLNKTMQLHKQVVCCCSWMAKTANFHTSVSLNNVEYHKFPGCSNFLSQNDILDKHYYAYEQLLKKMWQWRFY